MKTLESVIADAVSFTTARKAGKVLTGNQKRMLENALGFVRPRFSARGRTTPMLADCKTRISYWSQGAVHLIIPKKHTLFGLPQMLEIGSDGILRIY